MVSGPENVLIQLHKAEYTFVLDAVKDRILALLLARKLCWANVSCCPRLNLFSWHCSAIELARPGYAWQGHQSVAGLTKIYTSRIYRTQPYNSRNETCSTRRSVFTPVPAFLTIWTYNRISWFLSNSTLLLSLWSSNFPACLLLTSQPTFAVLWTSVFFCPIFPACLLLICTSSSLHSVLLLLLHHLQCLGSFHC